MEVVNGMASYRERQDSPYPRLDNTPTNSVLKNQFNEIAEGTFDISPDDMSPRRTAVCPSR
jgi:hypothetical protein